MKTRQLLLILAISALIVLAGCTLPSTGFAGESVVCAKENEDGVKKECGSFGMFGAPSQEEKDAAAKGCAVEAQTAADTRCAAFCKAEACNSGKATVKVTGYEVKRGFSKYYGVVTYDYSCVCYSGTTSVGGGSPDSGGGGAAGGPTTSSNECNADAKKAADAALVQSHQSKKKNPTEWQAAYETACGTCEGEGKCKILNKNCVPCGEDEGTQAGEAPRDGSGANQATQADVDCSTKAAAGQGKNDAALYWTQCGQAGECDGGKGTCGKGTADYCACIPKPTGSTGTPPTSGGGGGGGGPTTGDRCKWAEDDDREVAQRVPKNPSKTLDQLARDVCKEKFCSNKKDHCDWDSEKKCFCPGSTAQNQSVSPEQPGNTCVNWEPGEPGEGCGPGGVQAVNQTGTGSATTDNPTLDGTETTTIPSGEQPTGSVPGTGADNEWTGTGTTGTSTQGTGTGFPAYAQPDYWSQERGPNRYR